MKLKRGIQKKIREKTGFCSSYVSDVCNGKVRFSSWVTAKKFAEATDTDPMLWLEGSPDEIQQAISQKEVAA